MLSDLAILAEEAANNEEFGVEDVRRFLAPRVATREGTNLTKADVTIARTHFVGERLKTGPRHRLPASDGLHKGMNDNTSILSPG
jgi:hypothetical protein